MKNCTECCKAQLQRAEPLIPTPLPKLPWQKIATDLFLWKNNWYVLTVDYYSRYIEIALLNRISSTEVIAKLKSIFARHGIPEIVVSDGGKQYVSEEFEQFAKDYGFQHSTSSPYFPQSNGEAERAVRTVKSLLNKSNDPYLALLAYRSTPVLGSKHSPAELLMNRKLRTTIPSTLSHREPQVPDAEKVREKDRKIKLSQKKNHDQRKGAKVLPSIEPGSLVWMTDRKEQATVQQEVAPRSIEVLSENGATYRRNRRDLIPLPSQEEVTTEPENEEVTTEPENEEETIDSTNDEATTDPPVEHETADPEITTPQTNTPTNPRRSNRTPHPTKRYQGFEKH